MFIFNNFVIVLFISVFAGGWSTESGAQVDLIQGLQVFDNSSFQGVSLVSGPNLYSPALAMSGSYRAVMLPAAVRDRVVDLLASSDEFTVMASIQHDPHNAATILAITAGSERLLEVQSSGRTDEVRFHYTRRRGEADDAADVHVESFHQPLADGLWHRLSVSVSGTQLSLYVDCVLVHSRTILPLSWNLTEFASSGRPLQLWLGQRNTQHFLLQGALQDVKFVFGSHGYLAQCPEQDSSCPSCGQFQSLQDTVDKLQHIVSQLTLRLKRTEESLKQLETCECQRSCRFNNSLHADGTSWNHDCSICACLRGEVQCRPKKCPELSCGHPYYEQGECCPKCKDGCHWRGGLYQHGERVSIDVCTTCVCKESRMQCSSTIPDQDCPRLPCSPDQRVTVTGQCCQFCRGDDYCLLTRPNCHPNATCINLQAGYSCQCNPGFIGNGITCEDVDECSAVDGPGGHHCGFNTLCINTLGSYRCDCTPGYERRDGYRCVERNECLDGTHVCSEHAVCINSPAGSYTCRCADGYAGDGRTCSPVCRPECRNGGLCVAPDQCSCRAGFVGPGCETDLDECKLGVHRCSPNTRCVNMPGWYRCECRPGYRAPALSSPARLLSCTDVDECVEGTDTCDVRSTCVNTDGSYTCRCPDGICSRDCRVDGGIRVHGDTWQDKRRGCRTCRCDDGVVTCTRTTCDCSDPHVDPICCPQCDLRDGCFHQTLSNVRFNNGDRWLHDCQQCECLMGEIDCWRMECAPVACADPVWRPGDCCGRCPGDPCAPSPNGSIMAPCHLTEPSSSRHQVQPLASAVRWQTRCPECLCQVPFCDKLVAQHSSSSNRRASWLTMVSTLAVLCLLWSRCQQEIHQHPLPQHTQQRRSVGRRRHLGSRTSLETLKCSRYGQPPPDPPTGPAAAFLNAGDHGADGKHSKRTSCTTVPGPETPEPGTWRVMMRETSRNWRTRVIETRALRDWRVSVRETREGRRTSERTSSSEPDSCDEEDKTLLVLGAWLTIGRKSSSGPKAWRSQDVKGVGEDGKGDASLVVEEMDAIPVVEDLPVILILAHSLTRPERQLLGWILIEEAAVSKTPMMTPLRSPVYRCRHTDAPPSPRRTCGWRRHCSWSAHHLCLFNATALYASQE